MTIVKRENDISPTMIVTPPKRPMHNHQHMSSPSYYKRYFPENFRIFTLVLLIRYLPCLTFFFLRLAKTDVLTFAVSISAKNKRLNIMHAHFKNLKVVSSFQFIHSEFVQSTTIQLLRALDDWTVELDKGNEFDFIYIDFQKSFDSVPYRKLHYLQI